MALVRPRWCRLLPLGGPKETCPLRLGRAREAIGLEVHKDVLATIEHATSNLDEGDASSLVAIAFKLALRNGKQFGQVRLGDQRRQVVR